MPPSLPASMPTSQLQSPSTPSTPPPLPSLFSSSSSPSHHYQHRHRHNQSSPRNLPNISSPAIAKNKFQYDYGSNRADDDGDGDGGNGINSLGSSVGLAGYGPKIEASEGAGTKAKATTTASASTLSAASQSSGSGGSSHPKGPLPHFHLHLHRDPHQTLQTHQYSNPLNSDQLWISANPSDYRRPSHTPQPPPPRTSSLLPPPRNTNTKTLDSAITSATSPRHKRHHSRASSLGAASDGFRNLNRWSSSTTSSRASNSIRDQQYQQQQPQQQSQPFQSPPRKLVKRRPSNDTSASPKTRRLSPPPPPSSSVPPNLPPIVSLPPLDTNPESTVPDESLFTPSMSRASSAELWDDPPRMNTAARGNPALLPPANVIRDTMPERKGHARGRSSTARGSGDSTTRVRDRTNKPSQKAMLSKALAKANAAVQLDNAQNYGAARESYIEACDLLQQVLSRTSGEEDRRKLEAIRLTYTSRIDELDGLVPEYAQNDKALPARPESMDEYHDVQIELAGVDSPVETTTAARIGRSESPTTDFRLRSNSGQDQRPLQSSFSRSQTRRKFEGSSLDLLGPPSQDAGFMPAPLSPRRPISPAKPPTPEPIVRQDFSWPSGQLLVENRSRSHRRNISHESASWLDPINESGSSASSSVHSRSSSLGVRRKHIRHASGNTEAEFNAALDTAIEAAYDEGYEPLDYDDDHGHEVDEDVVVNAMRKVELAKERVRQTEREAAIELARERERQRQMSIGQESQTFKGDFFDANDSDEEERILEQMTRGYVMESQQPQSRVPRESDSSGITSRTWHSSVGSNPPTATTILSTVTEMPPPGPLPKTAPPSLPSPSQSVTKAPSSNQASPTSGVRNRRLSGQNPKQLKIETSRLGQPPNMPPPASAVQTKAPSGFVAQQRQALSATSTRPMPFSMRAPSSPVRGTSPAEILAPPSPSANQAGAQEYDDPRTDSPSSMRPGIRKNFSSSSLKSLKTRQFSISHIDDSDLSPNTPLSNQISNTSISRQPTIPALPTPLAAAFHERMTGGIGGLHLFDSDFHSPTVHSPNQLYHHHLHHGPDVPLPLEPCPSEAMLRPFWLMRALYQTLAHPRGGYISNRLFVPRDAWKVKGVKLRALDDKMSQCDLLTAALLKLARVDSNDADAVLEEMQSFENILEMVQATLTRRLGNEVGTQGMGAFRDDREAEPAPPVPRSASVSGKGGAFSWRRLRNKGSAANMTNAYGGKSNSGGSNGPGAQERDVISSTGSLSSLPMTAHPSNKPAKRDVASVNFDGPYGNYMASLARLFDAAQTVDQIARQVDDPGLRHADKTQVGLELCTRHAAEFFGFYICRFVLTDLALLLDKFVKRGSEWVLA